MMHLIVKKIAFHLFCFWSRMFTVEVAPQVFVALSVHFWNILPEYIHTLMQGAQGEVGTCILRWISSS